MTVSGALALVTGAGSGIGAATARALSADGARVIAADIDAERAESIAVDIGGVAMAVDVSDRERVAALAATVQADHGIPDILVNNAGVGMTGRALDMSLADWDWIIGINLLGAVNFCQAFGPAMTARRSGHVVNIASGLAYTPRGTEPGYCTTKAAVLAFSQCLRADWYQAGVGVTAICPGVINTDIVAGNTRFCGDRVAARAGIEKAFRRGHPPETVAAAIVAALATNRSVVPVGFEARIGWAARSLVPGRLADCLARVRFGSL